MRVKGKSLQLRLNGATIALATSATLNTTTQYSDDKTKDDAEGPYGDPEWVDWTMSSENIVGMSGSAQHTYEQLMDLQLAKTVLSASMELVANATGAVPDTDWAADTAPNTGFAAYGGNVTIESVNLTAPMDGKATISVNLRATGPLTKQTA